MNYILSWTIKKHQIIRSRPLHSKLKKIQGLFNDFPQNSRTPQDCANPVTYMLPSNHTDRTGICLAITLS